MSDMLTVATQLVKGCQTLVMDPSLLQQSLVNTVPHAMMVALGPDDATLFASPTSNFLPFSLLVPTSLPGLPFWQALGDPD